MQIKIDIPEDVYTRLFDNDTDFYEIDDILTMAKSIRKGTPLTPSVLADMLMEERIRGKLKQDISYSKDIIDDVRCKLTVNIIDHRPCYCGAELREVWREKSEDKE